MQTRKKNVAVLGSTGSIGRSALEVIACRSDKLAAIALTARSNITRLLEQAIEFCPRWIAVGDDAAGQRLGASVPPRVELLGGADALERIAGHPSVDIVLTAIVGAAGLNATLAALEAGKVVALANKETLVCAGSLVTRLAARHGAQILPVDSEHSAVFQALQAGRRGDVKRIVLTASGGPFRHCTPEQLATVTVEQALQHPTWSMGAKITVDSATMMNKALEIIEARWLFGLSADEIQVVVHPQSVVHSFVEFVDGSIVAQLGPPDMKLPIQYALSYPERWDGPARRLDWLEARALEFEPPDYERFPAIPLGLEVARVGGTAGAVLNAANEAAVAGFLAGELAFNEIVPTCRRVLEHHEYEAQPSLGDLLRLDGWARQEVSRCLCP